MKGKIIIFLLMLAGTTTYAQSWDTFGNTISSGDWLGTDNNKHLEIRTRNKYRIHLNPDRLTGISNFTNINTSGFMGLGPNTTSIAYLAGIWTAIGPLSLLHLNSGENGFDVSVNYRSWMKTGLTFTTNIDMAYIGLRSLGDQTDKTEATFMWSDSQGNGASGADDMVFRYITGETFVNNVTTPSTNLTDQSDFDGLHVARFTGNGLMGLGPTFGDPALFNFYVKPKSLLHLSRDNSKDTWLQITNQNGTKQTVTDGLRMGITNTGTAHIKQQENLPLIFYTNATEDARIVPNAASTMGSTNTGMMGIGDFSGQAMDAKLDIDGDLRVRQVTNDESLNMILVVDPADLNRVKWRDANNFGGIANNGLSKTTTNETQLGQAFSGTPNQSGPAQLLSEREIPLNEENIHFTGVGTVGRNLMSIGQPVQLGYTNPKVHLWNDTEEIGLYSITDFSNAQISEIASIKGQVQNFEGGKGYGVHGVVINPPSNSGTTRLGYGVFGESIGNLVNCGVRGHASTVNSLTAQTSYGGYFEAFGSGASFGVYGKAVDGNSGSNYGVYGIATGGINSNFAGYFQGDVQINGDAITTGNAWTPSDKNLKTEIKGNYSAKLGKNPLSSKAFWMFINISC